MAKLKFKLKKYPLCILANQQVDSKNETEKPTICDLSNCQFKLLKGFFCPVKYLDSELERARQKIFTLTNILYKKNIIDSGDLKKIGKFF